MAVGARLYVTAIFTTLVLLSALVIIGNLEQRLGLQSRMMNFLVTIPQGADIAGRVRKTVDEIGIRTRRWHSDQTDEGTLLEFEAEVTVPQERQLVTHLAALNVRSEARPISPVTAL
jgi:uncharacterized membrane protein YhiD involved in acid resistance